MNRNAEPETLMKGTGLSLPVLRDAKKVQDVKDAWSTICKSPREG